MLSERKKKILCAVVDSYIDKAEPVSSKDIQEEYLTECSSATIRNELSTLESMGYLVQPHVSAGRVPSEKAFRFYVNELMYQSNLTTAETEMIFVTAVITSSMEPILRLKYCSMSSASAVVKSL